MDNPAIPSDTLESFAKQSLSPAAFSDTPPADFARSPLEQWSPAAYWRSCPIALMVAMLAYATWIQWQGYAGLSCFMALASILIALGSAFSKPVRNSASHREFPPSWTGRIVQGLLASSLAIVSLRLLWQGDWLVALFAWVQLGLIAPAARYQPMALMHIPIHWLIAMVDGLFGWVSIPVRQRTVSQTTVLAWTIPSLVGLVFLIPLVLSHPNLASDVATQLSRMLEQIKSWVHAISFLKLFLSALVAVLCLGFLLPLTDWMQAPVRVPPVTYGDWSAEYVIIRNTLLVVIAVFSIFLVYEWTSLGFREFPPGFYYAGYAHQGALWLTVALAMATIVLSVLFSQRIHAHPKIATLQRLALIWSACNVILAIAVYHRMIIYVRFNGLTPMRIIGFAGATCVLIGFMLVTLRVLRAYDWKWLVHRQAWTLVLTIYVVSLLPVDWIAHRWNVREIENGHIAPAVQIYAQPISDEGLIAIVPLLDAQDSRLREGVASLIAARIQRMELEEATQHSWQAYQGSRQQLWRAIAPYDEQLHPYLESISRRESAWSRFTTWAYQWY